jgi:HTH-type transcriptional regulator/antitoxin HigA
MPQPTHRRVPKTYFQLVRRFPLVRIADDDELAGALAVVDDLLTHELDAGEEVYLGALTALIHAYESEHHPIPDATPAEVLRELADANELTGTAIAHRSGIVPSTVSALLSGKRRPTPEQMTALAAVFNVSPAVFLPAARTARRENRQWTSRKDRQGDVG